MAHKIGQFDKQEGTEQAWHGLTEVREKISLDDNWLTKWDLIELPLNYENGNASGFSMLGCTDDEEIKIGYPYNPETFSPISNKEFLELIRDSISGTDHEIATVGSIRNRGRVFVSLKLKGMESFESAGRKFSNFLNFGNGHDKSSVLWANTSNICTVCDNCFSFNLIQTETKRSNQRDDISTNIRHTKNAKIKFPEISKLIDLAVGVQGKFQVEMDLLEKEKVSASTVEKFTAGFLSRSLTEKELERRRNKNGKVVSTRSENIINRIVDLFQSGRGNDGNDWSDVFSAFTDYYTHESSGAKDSRSARMKQFVSSEFGSGLRNKQDAYNIITLEDKRESLIQFGEKILSMN